ncbi:hypothetical protein BSL78_05615 [Apostichopus japonicus]|uniref:Uncharacterized protein n=1 Tax=Stichopus japonicus TaxID=307972 RepID=A0A2G8LB41_STIJA|nr:hypothetical protein BSL78_05615 [Apostichopus japonicus]
MIVSYLQTRSSPRPPISIISPITDVIKYAYALAESMTPSRIQPNGEHFHKGQDLLQNLQVARLSPRNTPSLAITRSRGKTLINCSEQSVHGKNVTSLKAPSRLQNGETKIIIRKPVPPIQSLSSDWTNHMTPRQHTSSTIGANGTPSCHLYPNMRHDTRRNGFWKTVTRPTPGELSLKYRNKRKDGCDESQDCIYKRNAKDPDEIDTSFVLNLLENKTTKEEIHEQHFKCQRDEPQTSLRNFSNELNVLRSQDDSRTIDETSPARTETENSSIKKENNSALQRFASRLNSPTSSHIHSHVFCAECIPDVESSRLLGALDSYRREDSLEKSNQSLKSNVNIAHAQNVKTTENYATFNYRNRRLSKSPPEILVKIEDGSDHLKTVDIPGKIDLPSVKDQCKKPEVSLKLSNKQDKFLTNGQNDGRNHEEDLDTGSSPRYLTFSTAVGAVRKPPVPHDRHYGNSPVAKDEKTRIGRARVVNVMTHGKGALIIQQHKDLKSAKLDVFLPQVENGT